MAGGRARIDLLLVERGLAESRDRAQRLILSGGVRIADRVVDKPGTMVDCAAEVRLIGEDFPYVSRGGLKLRGRAAPVADRHARPHRLRRGRLDRRLHRLPAAAWCRHVIAVDVGYGQLAWRLRNDPRVTLLERTNIRHLRPEQLPLQPSLAVIDVSFISLRIVLPVVVGLLTPPFEVVALVKPQFEVGKGQVGKGGVVRDPALQQAAVDSIATAALDLGLEVVGSVESPIQGPKGNREYFLLVESSGRRVVDTERPDNPIVLWELPRWGTTSNSSREDFGWQRRSEATRLKSSVGRCCTSSIASIVRDGGSCRKTHAPLRSRRFRAGCDAVAVRKVCSSSRSPASAKSDVAFMAVHPDPRRVQRMGQEIAATALGACLTPVYSFLSISEVSEYMSRPGRLGAAARRRAEDGPGAPRVRRQHEAFTKRMSAYADARVHPQLPDNFPVICFYPMSKARGETDNWYTLDFADRKRLHGRPRHTGRRFADRVTQLISSSTGLDDWEWGVTLFARDLKSLRDVVYEMRFDPGSAVYGEFGPFYVGIRFAPDELRSVLKL